MFETLINCITVTLGTTIGLFAKKWITASLESVVTTSAGVVTLVLGFQMLGDDSPILAVLFSLIVGGLIGTFLRLEDRVISIGNMLSPSTSLGEGFLASSLLFCSGAMSIVGSIELGRGGDGKLILIKSVMDGFMAIVLAATYGKGVYLSAITILLYQGLFVWAGSWLESLLGQRGLDAIISVGGCLLIFIAFSLLKIKNIKTGDFIPALLIAPIFAYLFSAIS